MVGHQYWVNMTDRSDVQVNDMLSQSHRRAAVSENIFMYHQVLNRDWFVILGQEEMLDKAHGAEPFLISRQLCSYSRTSQHFMEPEGSLECP
jgi:hypothetical protein